MRRFSLLLKKIYRLLLKIYEKLIGEETLLDSEGNILRDNQGKPLKIK